MSPLTFIFFGPSGSGKGTQAKLLIEKLKEIDANSPVIYLETGQKFREFSTEASLTAKYVREIINSGGLIPEFLPIWIWTEYLVRHVAGNEHMILDGLSRRVDEAPVLDSAMKFYKRENPFVISIELSREIARDRLLNRKREDDKNLDIEKRLDWYENNVVPSINYFKSNPYYKFISVDGSQAIEDVHKQIVAETLGN